MYSQSRRNGGLSDGLAIEPIEQSRKGGSGHLPAGVGYVLVTDCPGEVRAIPYSSSIAACTKKHEWS